SGVSWTQQAYVKASNTGPMDMFGYAVAVEGDTAIAGASEEDSSSFGVNSTPNELGYNTGAAYFFVRSAGVWTQEAYVKVTSSAPNHAGDSFGYAVAISGDTAIVGAYLEDTTKAGQYNPAQKDSGGAYIFVRSGAIWKQQA